MAINKKLIHFKNKENFDNEVANGNILDTSIVFIQDSKQIWTHGEYYGHETLIFNDISVNSWTVIEDINFPYNYFSSIILDNVTEDDYAEVSFDISCAISGDYAPICETYDGGVKIYSKTADSITIPTIIIHKNYK